METFRQDIFEKQIWQPQGKLIRDMSGEVFDVAMDIRKASPFFDQWFGITLSSENKTMLWIPPGFDHGFYILRPEAELTCKCTNYYALEHERILLWNDSVIGIDD